MLIPIGLIAASASNATAADLPLYWANYGTNAGQRVGVTVSAQLSEDIPTYKLYYKTSKGDTKISAIGYAAYKKVKNYKT